MSKKKQEHPKALYKLRKVTRISALVILAVVLVGLLLPTDYKVERSVMIDAPPRAVLRALTSGETLPSWMFINNGQVEKVAGVYSPGQSVNIHYNKTDKLGRLTITKVSTSQLAFNVKPKPEVDVVHNVINLRAQANKTQVDWVIKGKLRAGLLSPYVALLANRIAGSNFETSLGRLKETVERQREIAP